MLLLVGCIYVGLGSTPATAQEQSLQVNFELGRDPLTRTLTLEVNPVGDGSIEDASVELRGDLQADTAGETAFPAAQVTPSATASGNTVKLTVIANPVEPEVVDAGTYTGALQVRGTGFAPFEVPIAVDLQDKSDKFWWALGALFCGALFGLLIRWVNNEGAVLGKLERRYHQTLSQLAPYDDADLPTGLANLRSQLKVARNLRDSDHISELLTSLDSQLDTLPYAKPLQKLNQDVDRQEELVHSSSSEPQLRPVISAERELIEEMRVLASGEDTTQLEVRLAQSRIDVETCLTLVQLWIEHNGKDSLVPEDWQALREARRAAVEQRYKDCREIISRFDTPALSLMGHLPRKRLWRRRGRSRSIYGHGPRGWVQRLRSWLVLQINSLIGLSAAAVITVVGLRDQFLDNAGFQAEFSDYFVLFVWGFGVALVGIEISQFGARLAHSPDSGTKSATP